MKRRAARSGFSTAQLALWDELESIPSGAPAHAEAPAEPAEHVPAPPPGPPAPEIRGGAR